MDEYNKSVWLKDCPHKCRSWWHISQSSDLVSHLEVSFMNERHTLGIMSQYDSKNDHIVNVGRGDLYFTVQWLCFVSWRLWCLNLILWDNKSVWRNIWPHCKCRSWRPIFYGSVVLPYILKTIWWMNIIFWDKSQCDTRIDLIINVGHTDLYFMVQ